MVVTHIQNKTLHTNESMKVTLDSRPDHKSVLVMVVADPDNSLLEVKQEHVVWKSAGQKENGMYLLYGIAEKYYRRKLPAEIEIRFAYSNSDKMVEIVEYSGLKRYRYPMPRHRTSKKDVEDLIDMLDMLPKVIK